MPIAPHLHWLAYCLLLAIPRPSFGEERRYSLEGDTLFFNMGSKIGASEWPDELVQADVEEFSLTIMDNPQIKTVVVTGPGGNGPAGISIAQKIISLGLDTTAKGGCISACVLIFMAGNNRLLADGAKLGFHGPYIIKEEEKLFFNHAKRRNGWTEEFDYVPFIYDVAYSDALRDIRYFSSRGVDLDFALRVLDVPSYELLFPDRAELLEVGVITSSAAPKLD